MVFIEIHNCKTCAMCCQFFNYFGYKVSFSESLIHLGFSKRLTQLFFRDIGNGKYLIEKMCRQFDKIKGSCGLVNTNDYPFTCAIFPFMLATDNKSNINLYIETNCPESDNAMLQISEITKIIDYYKKNRLPIDIFVEKKLKKIGYELKLIQESIMKE